MKTKSGLSKLYLIFRIVVCATVEISENVFENNVLRFDFCDLKVCEMKIKWRSTANPDLTYGLYLYSVVWMWEPRSNQKRVHLNFRMIYLTRYGRERLTNLYVQNRNNVSSENVDADGRDRNVWLLWCAVGYPLQRRTRIEGVEVMLKFWWRAQTCRRKIKQNMIGKRCTR